MELISISEVKPGQVIARAVNSPEGAILCPPGFVLTEMAIARLKRNGVESVVLEGGGEHTADLERRLLEIEKRFERVDDAIMLQIKATVEKRLSFMLMERRRA